MTKHDAALQLLTAYGKDESAKNLNLQIKEIFLRK